MRGTILLALFVVLTMVFASISAYEYLNLGVAAPATTTVTATITAQIDVSQKHIQFKSGPNPLSDSGYVTIGGMDLFNYTRIPTSTVGPAASTTLQNVTFTYVRPNATITGCIQYEFKATFQDGSSENLTAQSCPTNFETTLVLSKHGLPTAGLLLVVNPAFGIYALVSD